MKQNLIATAVVAATFAAAFHVLAADDLPKAPAFARYEAMMNRSPFAVATAPAPAPAATPNFAKDLYIANAARTPDGDLVTIASSTDKNFKKYLSTKTTVDGYSVPTIEWSERVGATKVTISKDGQFATLTFNQALISQATPTTPQMAGQPQVPPINPVNNVVPSATNAVPQPYPVPNTKAPGGATTALPTPPPRVRGVIQRNPNAPEAAPTPMQPQGQMALPDE
jgi:hypothetical protein